MPDPDHDPWLQAALRHAPDADAAPPAALSAAILRAARAAAALPRATAVPGRIGAFWAWVVRPPVAAAFASVTLATTIGVMWRDAPVDPRVAPEETSAQSAPRSSAAAPDIATDASKPAEGPAPAGAAAPSPMPRAVPPAPAARITESRARPATPPVAKPGGAAQAPRAEAPLAEAQAPRAEPPATVATPQTESAAADAVTAAAPAAQAAATAPAAERAAAAAGLAAPEATAPAAEPVAAAADRAAAGLAAAAATAPAAERAAAPAGRAAAGLAAPAALAPPATRRADASGGRMLSARKASATPAPLFDAVRAQPQRWAWQRGADAPRPVDAALLGWLRELETATPRWQRPGAVAPRPATLVLARDGDPRATVYLDADQALLVIVDDGVWGATLPPEAAAALAAALERIAR